MSFSLDISKFVTKTNDNLEKVIRKVCIDMSRGVIEKTPVDTGRAKANWTAARNSKPQGTTDSVDPSGGSTINAATSEAEGLQLGDTFYLINSLPYIRVLEDGHSQQAPQGMVKVSIVEYRGIVDRAAKGVK